ncbi:MAG: response regulator [candidate division Zixibacteria bacterium]|nr:response regulator [candidate division Zixibacteria bacterium]
MSDKKIMIVDDDRDMLRGLNVRLRASGYETVFANDAISAISTAKKEKPNLIILDLGLPAGDGYVVMERLKGMTQLAAIPIVVLSARDPMFHQDRSLKAGAQAFLQKPADNDVLMAVVRKSLGDAAA